MNRPYVAFFDAWRMEPSHNCSFLRKTDPGFMAMARRNGIRGNVMVVQLRFSVAIPRITEWNMTWGVRQLDDVLQPYLHRSRCYHLGQEHERVSARAFFAHQPEDSGSAFVHLLAHVSPLLGEAWLRLHRQAVPPVIVESGMTTYNPSTGRHGAYVLLSIDPGLQYIELGNRLAEVADAMASTLWDPISDFGLTPDWWMLALTDASVDTVELRDLRHRKWRLPAGAA